MSCFPLVSLPVDVIFPGSLTVDLNVQSWLLVCRGSCRHLTSVLVQLANEFEQLLLNCKNLSARHKLTRITS